MRLKYIVKKYAFTMLEMVISIIVVGVLASVALPNYSMSLERARSIEGLEILSSILHGQKAYVFEKAVYADNINKLDITIPASIFFNSPSAYVDDTNVSSIARNNGLYTLKIDINGVVACTGNTTLCTKMGYTVY